MSTDNAAASDHELPLRRAWPAYLCMLFVMIAVVAEFIGGRGGPALSTHHGRSISPSTWPDAARVIWWLLVASAAGAYRALADWVERRRPRLWLAALTGLPFFAFAVGIATNSSWASFR